MSCYRYSFSHKQLLNCSWVQQQTTVAMDHTGVTATVAKEAGKGTGKLCKGACDLMPSLVTCKELKIIKRFGPLVQIIFLAQAQA